MKTILILVVCVFTAAAVTSCKDDTVTPPPPFSDGFKDLSRKDHVLQNLKLSYDERHIARFDELLDDAFIFYFDDADHMWGGTPVQWDRTHEMQANTNLFDPDNPADTRALTIDLQLTYKADGWTEEPADAVHPGESWYRQVVGYDLVVVTEGGWEYRALKLQAQFAIRWDEDEGKWQIVQLRDLGADTLSRASSPAVETATWGRIKVLYQ